MSSLSATKCPECGEFAYDTKSVCAWCGSNLFIKTNQKITIGAYIDIWKNLIKNPLSLFKQSSLHEDIRGGRIILYLTGVMMAAHIFFILLYIDSLGFNANPLSNDFLGFLVNLGVWFLLFVLFITMVPFFFLFFFEFCWKIATSLIVNILKIMGRFPDYKKTKSSLGYAMLPVLLAWSVTLLFRLFIPLSPVPTSLTYSDLRIIFISSQSSFFGILITFTILLSWFWSFALAIIGIREVNEISYFEVVIASALPFGLFFILYIIN